MSHLEILDYYFRRFYLRFVCFDGKPYIKIVFRVFQCLVALEKMSY